MAEITQTVLIDKALCGRCGGCVAVCATNAIYLSPAILEIDADLCTGCGECVITCPVGALRLADG